MKNIDTVDGKGVSDVVDVWLDFVLGLLDHGWWLDYVLFDVGLAHDLEELLLLSFFNLLQKSLGTVKLIEICLLFGNSLLLDLVVVLQRMLCVVLDFGELGFSNGLFLWVVGVGFGFSLFLVVFVVLIVDEIIVVAVRFDVFEGNIF